MEEKQKIGMGVLRRDDFYEAIKETVQHLGSGHEISPNGRPRKKKEG